MNLVLKTIAATINYEYRLAIAEFEPKGARAIRDLAQSIADDLHMLPPKARKQFEDMCLKEDS